MYLLAAYLLLDDVAIVLHMLHTVHMARELCCAVALTLACLHVQRMKHIL
jgi:hypothetical protein